MPSGVYTHPEVATVGLSEQQAKEQHDNIKVAKFQYTASGIAQAYGETEGMVKLTRPSNEGTSTLAPNAA